MKQGFPFVLTAVAATLSAGLSAPARGDEPTAAGNEVLVLSRPESSIRIGLGHFDGNTVRLGQFTEPAEGLQPSLSFSLAARDDETGTLSRFDARNLELAHREARIEYGRQGHWKLALDYNSVPRFFPLAFNTRLDDPEQATQKVDGLASPRSLALASQRESWGLSARLATSDALTTRVRVKQEKRTGSRPFGFGRNDLQFIGEPLDTETRDIEASAAYSTRQFQLLGGYLGSWFKNHIPGVTANGREMDNLSPATDPNQIALPQGNEAHQLFLSGGWGISSTTRANFKLSRERARQTQPFIDLLAGNALVGSGNLDGTSDTTLISAGLTANASKDLAFLANFRHEDYADRTPVRQYVVADAASPHGLNVRFPHRTAVGKVEATYRLAPQYTVTAGVNHEQRQREVPAAVAALSSRAATFRTDTEENGYRLELRRSLSFDFNGSLAYVASKRSGSALLPADANASHDFVVPLHFADRDRAKWRMELDWVPSEPVSIQAVVENADDRYAGHELGPKKSAMRLYSLDVTYSFDNWQLTGWLSQTTNSAEQSTCGAITRDRFCRDSDPSRAWAVWGATLGDQSNGAGVTVRGTPTRKIKLGADLLVTRDTNEHDIALIEAQNVTLPAALPPDIRYDSTNLTLFLEYALGVDDTWRFDYGYQRVRTNDWTWNLTAGGTTSVYADGTTVDMNKETRASFVGMSYRYRWR